MLNFCEPQGWLVLVLIMGHTGGANQLKAYSIFLLAIGLCLTLPYRRLIQTHVLPACDFGSRPNLSYL